MNGLRQKVEAKVAAYAAARAGYRTAKRAAQTAEAAVADAEAALAFAQGVAQHIQEEAHRKIADVVSRSLAAVFDDPYEFTITFEQKRGRTEANLAFVRNGEAVDPMQAAGGGAVDVAAFALRLSCLMLARPPVRRLLVMDEPFKHLSKDLRPSVRALLATLATELGVQLIIVTHDPALVTGTVVEL